MICSARTTIVSLDTYLAHGTGLCLELKLIFSFKIVVGCSGSLEQGASETVGCSFESFHDDGYRFCIQVGCSSVSPHDDGYRLYTEELHTPSPALFTHKTFPEIQIKHIDRRVRQVCPLSYAD